MTCESSYNDYLRYYYYFNDIYKFGIKICINADFQIA